MAVPVVNIRDPSVVSPFLVKCSNPCIISADVSGHPQPTVTWYIDRGERVVNGTQFQIRSLDGGRTHCLTIIDVGEEFDKRLLTVFASNIHGSDTSMIDLKTFKVYPKYQPPDMRRIPETLGASDSPKRRRSLSVRRQSHSIPRSLVGTSSHPQIPDLVMGQTGKMRKTRTRAVRQKVTRKVLQIETNNAPHLENSSKAAARSASAAFDQSNTLASTRSYDSGIGDTARHSGSGFHRLRYSSSVDDVFLELLSPEIPATTTFSESYELRPDDTPLTVDIHYKTVQPSNPHSAVSEGSISELSNCHPKPPVDKKWASCERGFDAGCADLGLNLQMLAGKKMNDIYPEILKHGSKESQRISDSKCDSKTNVRTRRIRRTRMNDDSAEPLNLHKEHNQFDKTCSTNHPCVGPNHLHSKKKKVPTATLR